VWFENVFSPSITRDTQGKAVFDTVQKLAAEINALADPDIQNRARLQVHGYIEDYFRHEEEQIRERTTDR
jgi:hypothetical protein